MSSPEDDRLADVALGSQAEAEWERFHAQLKYSSSFWLGFLFTPSPYEAHVFLSRVRRHLGAEGRRVEVVSADRPEELREVLNRIPFSEELASAGCSWIEALHVDAPAATVTPWQDAWDHLFLRLNERRDAIRKRFLGGLVFVAPPDIKPRVREAAPDLWSVRALVVELEPVARPAMMPPPLLPVRPVPPRISDLSEEEIGPISRRPYSLGSPPSSTWATHGDSPSPDPEFALVQVAKANQLRPPPPLNGLGEAAMLLDSSEKFLDAGDNQQAKRAAEEALGYLANKEVPLACSRAFAALARAEWALGEYKEAEEHIRKAIDERRNLGGVEVPLEWFNLAGRCAYRRGDFKEARRIYEVARAWVYDIGDCRAEQALIDGRISEILLVQGDFENAIRYARSSAHIYIDLAFGGPIASENLAALSFALKRLGNAYREAGRLIDAEATFEEAVQTDRRICERLPGDVNAMYQLSYSLNRLAAICERAGKLERARALLGEALNLRRRIYELRGASQRTLWDLSSSLQKVAENRVQSRDLIDAEAALQEAVELDHRLCTMNSNQAVALWGLATSLLGLSDLRLRRGDSASAAELAQESVETARKLLEVSDDPEQDRMSLIEALRALARAKRALGQEDEARQAEDEAESRLA